MKLARTLNPALLNAAANHPDVYPYLGTADKSGPIDLSGVVANADNICLAGEHGGFVLERVSADAFEIHSIFTPAGRHGLSGVAREWMRYVFTRTSAERLLTKVPADNAAADALAKRCGFREVFVRPGVWPMQGGGLADVSYREITFAEWRAQDETLAGHGEWFHDRLEKAKAQAGIVEPLHPHDEAHDRAVGAAVLMLRAGNVARAVEKYNEWALFAGYAPIAVVSHHPVVIVQPDAVIEVKESDMEVLQCR